MERLVEKSANAVMECARFRVVGFVPVAEFA
jgi:hypothetical protein